MFFCLMELVVRNDKVSVREDMRGLMREWRDQDMPFKTVTQFKFAEQFGSFFSAECEQAAQQFYETARKTFGAVVHQLGRAMSRLMEH